MIEWIIAGGLLLAGTGTAVAAKAQVDQSRLARKESRVRKQQAALQKKRDITDSVRAMQAAIAQQQVAAGAAGMSFTGSSFLGATAGTRTSTTQNIQNINQSFDFEKKMADLNAQYAQSAALGNIGTGIANLGGTMISGAGTMASVR